MIELDGIVIDEELERVICPTSLADIMREHGCDKFHHHHYEAAYEQHFEKLRDKPLKLLEIGVGGYMRADDGGEGLRVWRDYFQQAEITGLDVFTKKLDLGPRVKIFRGAQGDETILNELNEWAGPFDIIIDDGSHCQPDILKSFQTLFPLMAPGGIYVIEDLHTAYDPNYGGDARFGGGEQTVRQVFWAIVDAIHHKYVADMPKLPSANMITSFHLYERIAFIYHA